ncbi:MAG: hypothetical protein H6Q54_1611 [Deltaproteobacteria bacterium]|nr:hypothetical protein [Deltaproteobacteria bacterium]
MKEPMTKPFKGILYNRQKIGDIASCVCPPYDVVSSVRTYYERDPFNAIRLELPMSQPSMDKYNVARHTMEQWLRTGVLQKDTNDTIYVYEQEIIVDEIHYLRRGFIGLNRLQKERILTHEETRKKAKEDRERLITTLKTYTSLVFALYEDKEEAIEDILISSQKEKLYDFVDEQSITNRFYRMTDPDEMDTLVSLMESKKIYIADGHHRLAVSYKIGLEYIPLYLTNMYSTGIVIFPYHRIIKFNKPRSLNELLSLLEERVKIEKFPLTDNNSPRLAAQKINTAPKPSYIMYSKDDPNNFYILSEKSPVYMDPSVHESVRKLKVSILHMGILKSILNVQDEEISFTQALDKSVTQVKDGTLDLAFFLPPTLVEEVKEIADNSLYMPAKSTFFYPKILTGLVFYQYD